MGWNSAVSWRRSKISYKRDNNTAPSLRNIAARGMIAPRRGMPAIVNVLCDTVMMQVFVGVLLQALKMHTLFMSKGMQYLQITQW